MARQRANATRWRWPPESEAGRRSSTPLRPTAIERGGDLGAVFGALDPARAQRIADILAHAHVRPQRVALEHEPT